MLLEELQNIIRQGAETVPLRLDARIVLAVVDGASNGAFLNLHLS